MAELWHRTTQAVEHLSVMMHGLRMRQNLPLHVSDNELPMALTAASFRLMRELATSALETIALVRDEYAVIEAQARSQTKRPTLTMFAFSADEGKAS